LRADCQEVIPFVANRATLESGLPRVFSIPVVANRGIGARFAKGLFLSWQIAALERGLPQQSEIQYQPFYIDSPLVHGAVSFFLRDFTSIRPIRGGLSRPKLSTNGHSLHTIS
jgi:hypothetical protein